MQPKISVIIPARQANELRKAIFALARIDYPPELIEVVGAYGRQPSVQRNRASRVADGDYILFLDNDAMVATDYLRIMVDEISRHPDIAIIGGPNITPDTDSFFQKCTGYALASRFAHSDMAARYRPIGAIRQGSEKELILCALMVKTSDFRELGGFNEALYPNEENEFLNRASAAGKTIIYHPQAVVYRSRRRNLLDFIGQLANYGRGRMEQCFIEGFKLSNSAFLLPLAFLLYLVSLLFFHPFWYLIPLIFYLLLGHISSAAFARMEKNPLYGLALPWFYMIMHLSYGAGMIWALMRRLTGINKRKMPDASKGIDVTIERIKHFTSSWNHSLNND